MKEQDLQVDGLNEKGVARRKILAGAGALAAGAALAQFGGMVSSATASSPKSNKWPWPYKKLDPAKTARASGWFLVAVLGCLMTIGIAAMFLAVWTVRKMIGLIG